MSYEKKRGETRIAMLLLLLILAGPALSRADDVDLFEVAKPLQCKSGKDDEHEDYGDRRVQPVEAAEYRQRRQHDPCRYTRSDGPSE